LKNKTSRQQREDMDKGILCKYFFQQTLVETTSFPQDNEIACLLLSSRPTLAEIREKFPFRGTYHFRVLIHPTNSSSYLWFDLTDPNQIVPSIQDGEIKIKVLQLSPDDSLIKDQLSSLSLQMDPQEEQRFASFFRWQEQKMVFTSTNNVLKDVKKAFTSKMKFSATKMWEKAQTIANNMQNTNNNNSSNSNSNSNSSNDGGGGDEVYYNNGEMAPPNAIALANLAKLIRALRTTLSASNPEHMALLQRLWKTQTSLDQEEIFPMNELQNLLTLQSLVFFHEVYSQIALDILENQVNLNTHTNTNTNTNTNNLKGKKNNNNNNNNYMTIANQIILILADILSLKNGSCVGLERSFWGVFEKEEQNAFYQLFSIAMRFFDDSFHQNHQDLDKNNKKNDIHLEKTRHFIMDILKNAPDSMNSFMDEIQQQKWV
jgi:hypothetical protein